MMKCYKKDGFIWFPRRISDEHDIGIPSSSIYMIEDRDEYSFVKYNEGTLRAYEPAEQIAETLWGKGKLKKTPTGAYVHKDL